MISTAPASVGKPKPKACSMAWIMSVSSISSAAGTMPAAMIPLTVSVAWSTLSKTPSRVRPASGSRVRPTVTLVVIPKVPSLPTIRPVRS